MFKRLITIIITVALVLFLAACSTTSTVTDEGVKSKANLKDASSLNTELAVGYIQRKQYKPAREKLEKAIDQDSDNFEAYKTLAYLYALLGLTDKAEEQYNTALELNPDDADLSNSYGAFLCSIGKLDEAQEKLKVAYSNPFYDFLILYANKIYLNEFDIPDGALIRIPFPLSKVKADYEAALIAFER